MAGLKSVMAARVRLETELEDAAQTEAVLQAVVVGHVVLQAAGYAGAMAFCLGVHSANVHPVMSNRNHAPKAKGGTTRTSQSNVSPLRRTHGAASRQQWRRAPFAAAVDAGEQALSHTLAKCMNHSWHHLHWI